ncbi:MAG: hypothetical protein AAFZ07_08980 [Actinomycetota bacterium]
MQRSVECRFCGIAVTTSAVEAGAVVYAGTNVAHRDCVAPPHAERSGPPDGWHVLQFNRFAEIVAIV